MNLHHSGLTSNVNLIKHWKMSIFRSIKLLELFRKNNALLEYRLEHGCHDRLHNPFSSSNTYALCSFWFIQIITMNWFNWLQLILNYPVYPLFIYSEKLKKSITDTNSSRQLCTKMSLVSCFTHANICSLLHSIHTFLFQFFHIILFLWGITVVMTTSSIHKQIYG